MTSDLHTEICYAVWMTVSEHTRTYLMHELQNLDERIVEATKQLSWLKDEQARTQDTLDSYIDTYRNIQEVLDED